ncbi:MAG: hypothetical protein DCC65_14860 [Planctomycetota bacterium]|nr:MAG: hypothetical protein DCC65_14860 [Planctomycetota bacterium]
MSNGPRGRISRRRFIGSGLTAAAMGLMARRGVAVEALLSSALKADSAFGPTSPLRKLPGQLDSAWFLGLPFARWFTGDDFTQQSGYPFHSTPPCCPGSPPPPNERADVVVVGGGISGLATAVMLEHHHPIVLELHEQFGGNAAGEVWENQPYSIGSAYVITPDKGSFLEQFYRDLGLDRVHRFAGPQDPIELGGRILFDFWTGQNRPPEEQKAFARYAEVVRYMAEESYPEIPLPEGKDNQWIIDLDRKTLWQDIEDQMGMPMPPLLAAAVQGYCYSSFGAGMQDISAAAGWNFLAAEEFGRWVFPGGNAYMSWAMWQRLRQLDDCMPPGQRPYHVRSQCMVVDVRLVGDGVQVTYLDPQRKLQSIAARYAVVACPKHVARYLIHGMEELDAEKSRAIPGVSACAYVVANVLLDAPVHLDFYDIFLLGDESFPVDPVGLEGDPRVIDLLAGHYAKRVPGPRSVLTLYMPFPYGINMRPPLIVGDPWERLAGALAPQIERILHLLALPKSAVRQIRMTRWGHAFPIARPEFIADGSAEYFQRPIGDRIFFANQDNWALPAVENSLLDADRVARQISAGLGGR